VTDTEENPATPPAKPIKLGRVNTLHGARKALLRVTQAVLDGAVSPKVGNAGIYGLSAVVKCLEVEVLERRLDAIEKRVEESRTPGLPLPSAQLPRMVGHA
jgi:hypothetical protein